MNNRIIKFRAWLTNGDKVTYSIGSHMEYNVTITDNKYAVVESGREIEETYDYHLMQYTGLKDKNGKEIYENDIIATKGYVTVVRYEAPKFCCRYDKGKAEMMDFDPFEECEVIGNVYENPELLTIIN